MAQTLNSAYFTDDYKFDNVLQNRQVNQFVDEGVDLLVISPNQLSAISKAEHPTG